MANICDFYGKILYRYDDKCVKDFYNKIIYKLDGMISIYTMALIIAVIDEE